MVLHGVHASLIYTGRARAQGIALSRNCSGVGGMDLRRAVPGSVSDIK